MGNKVVGESVTGLIEGSHDGFAVGITDDNNLEAVGAELKTRVVKE